MYPLPQVIFRNLSAADLPELHHLLEGLHAETKLRFAPHAFDRQGIADYFRGNAGVFAVGGFHSQSGEMVAYAVLRRGYHDYEYARFLGYGFLPCRNTDCMFAPVVADHWQGMGIGQQLFKAATARAKAAGIKRMILWGGVQASNKKALQYYRKLGFSTVGSFLYHGLNEEMVITVEV